MTWQLSPLVGACPLGGPPPYANPPRGPAVGMCGPTIAPAYPPRPPAHYPLAPAVGLSVEDNFRAYTDYYLAASAAGGAALGWLIRGSLLAAGLGGLGGALAVLALRELIPTTPHPPPASPLAPPVIATVSL